jgi:hypothetical protein
MFTQVITYYVPSPMGRYLNLLLKYMQEQENKMLCIGASIWWAFCNVHSAEELGELKFL